MATTQMIRTEPLQTQPRWTSLSGRILEGGYELQDLLEATDIEARFKVRVLGDRELDSVALIFQIPSAEIERQVELWQGVRMLRHPNLSAPLGAGRLLLDSLPLAYVVLRRADEALVAVLSERSLNADEMGEALMSLTRALEALHLNGWVHGCVSPNAVLAVGDYIQLPAECVRTAGIAPAAKTIVAKYLAPESAGVNLTPEADLWCLGATLFEALTQKTWTESSREELDALPEPFATIAFRCLETDPEARCSLAEAVALYRGELKLPPRVRTAAQSSIIVPEKEISVKPEGASVQPHEPTPAHLSVPLEPETKEQPKAKVLVEETLRAAETPVASAADPKIAASALAASASTAQASGTDKVVPHLPEAAAMAALAPEVDARVTGGQEKTSPSPSNGSSAYTQPKPSLVARPNRGETEEHTVRDEEEGTNRKLWVGAGLALLLVIVLIWSLRPKQQAPATASNLSSKTGAPAAGQSSNGSAWQTHTLGPGAATSGGNTPHSAGTARHGNTTAKPVVSPSAPDAMKPNAHSQAAKVAPKPEGPAAKGNVWRVILYTYNRLPDAERMAKTINAKHNGLHVEVFSPSGGSSPYLVTTGSLPSRDEALQARRKVIGAGVAHDAYLQNYSK